MPDLEPNTDRAEIVEDAPIQQVVTEDFIRRLEIAADLYQHRYLPLCVKLTNEADWINHGSKEKPKYGLQTSGAEKVANPLGINWDRPAVIKHEREDANGKFYEYEVEGLISARMLRRLGWFTGNCSSRDQFFAARGRFDEGDIRKAAFSNWLLNGITRLAGIRNPTPELLRKAGLNPERIESVDYSGRRSPERDAEVISEAQGKRLWAIAKAKEVSEERLRKKLAAFGFDSFKAITRGKYDAIVAWVERGGPEDNGTEAPHAAA